MEDRILAFLSQRASTPERLADHLGVTVEEVGAQLAETERKGWTHAGVTAWYGNDPDSGITVISLTPAGRKEAERRQAISDPTDEPIVITRDELTSELRRLGMTEEQIAMNPTLRHTRFRFWPSISAWSGLPD